MKRKNLTFDKKQNVLLVKLNRLIYLWSIIQQTMTTLEKLRKKSDLGSSVRMPSISQISSLLAEYGIAHDVYSTTNVVEYRSKGKTYVNSRHNGKTGLKLVVKNSNIVLDTTDSYYSWNTWRYAMEIVKLVETVNK